MGMKQGLMIGLGVAVGLVFVGGASCLGVVYFVQASLSSSNAASQAKHDQARKLALHSDAQQIHSALMKWTKNHNDRWPTVVDKQLLKSYLPALVSTSDFTYQRPPMASTKNTPQDRVIGCLFRDGERVSITAGGQVDER